MQGYSRLQSKRNRLTQKRAYVLMLVSVVLIVALLKFGLPALFNLTQTISSINRKPTNSSDVNIAPNAPTLSPDFEATNTAHIKISGVADVKISVQLFQNGQLGDTTIAGDDGKFQFDVDLTSGQNRFQAQATSDKGVKSAKSETYTVNYVNQQPSVTITSPKNGDTIKDSPTQIVGKTDPGDTILVNGRMAVVDSVGNFSIYLNLNNGDNKISVAATDQAGNQKTTEITIKYSP